MTKVIGVRFPSGGRIYYFDPLDLAIQPGDGVIVETARGQEYGTVIQGITEVEETVIVSPLKPVIRVATESDDTMRAQNTGKEEEAFAICAKKIQQHGLDMKLVDVEYAFNGSKVVFYFTADERVDFRELVKDLAAQFRTRIELRQIGVRDEAKMLGGLGSCGRPVCCKSFMDEFRPVSIKMAKEQNLSLSPTKISGLCGRLMCCLQYEQAAYEEMKKKMPRTGREVLTPDGPGMAVENNAITEKTRVRLTLPDGSIDMREYHYSLLAKPGEPLPVPPEKQPEPVENQAAAPEVTANAPQASSQPETAETVPSNGNTGNNKRRRRGGRGRSRSQEGQAPAEGAASGESETKQSPRPPRQQPRQQSPRQPSGQDQNGTQLPAASRQSGQPAPEGAEDKPNPNKRRRHRSGSRRPKPEGVEKQGE